MKDVLVTVKIDSFCIDMLNRILEGAGHIGIMSTLDQDQGVVLIRATEGTAPDLIDLIKHLPFSAAIINN